MFRSRVRVLRSRATADYGPLGPSSGLRHPVRRPRISSRTRLGWTALLSLALAHPLLAPPVHALLVDFEDLGLAAESFLDPPSAPGGFSSGGVFFENDGSFVGFSASTTTDTSTPGFTNQYSNITGSGAAGSRTFGVAFSDATLVLPRPTVVAGAEFTNTTFAALSMRDGDAFAKQFGGPTGTDPDFFRLIVEGLDGSGISTGTVELSLADFTFEDDSLDFILEEWVFLDLSGLGVVRELRLGWESSDVGPFGINTPTYVAIDNLVIVPEPAGALLIGFGLALLSLRLEPTSAIGRVRAEEASAARSLGRHRES
ncbi:MAG: DUF4465 domain-containing protein [bacterium]